MRRTALIVERASGQNFPSFLRQRIFLPLGMRNTLATLWHSGETIGFRNVIVRWPEERLTVIILSNRNEPEPYRTALQIAGPYLH